MSRPSEIRPSTISRTYPGEMAFRFHWAGGVNFACHWRELNGVNPIQPQYHLPELRGGLAKDELSIPVKVEFDEYYLKNRSFFLVLKIWWMTFVKVVKREGVTH